MNNAATISTTNNETQPPAEDTVAWRAPNGAIRDNKADFLSVGFPEDALRPLIYGDDASTKARLVPVNWEQKLLDAMDEAFAITDRKGKHAQGALVIDDTQVGVEFAIEQIKAMLGAAAR